MKILSSIKTAYQKIAAAVLKRKIISLLIVLSLSISGIILNFYMSLPNVKGLMKMVPSSSSMIMQRINENAEEGRILKIKKKWAPLAQIPELLKKTVIVSEDMNFYNHKGIDYYELKESIKKNLSTGKRSRGGSTITQQLAKNLFLSSEKSYYRKLKEFFIAKRLEKHLSKKRILELYLNIIEFGRGIFGVGAASEFFFSKRVDQLSNIEIIRLISVIPKPLRVTPLSDSGYLRWRANLLINRLFKSRSIEEEEFIMLKNYFRE